MADDSTTSPIDYTQPFQEAALADPRTLMHFGDNPRATVQSLLDRGYLGNGDQQCTGVAQDPSIGGSFGHTSTWTPTPVAADTQRGAALGIFDKNGTYTNTYGESHVIRMLDRYDDGSLLALEQSKGIPLHLSIIPNTGLGGERDASSYSVINQKGSTPVAKTSTPTSTYDGPSLDDLVKAHQTRPAPQKLPDPDGIVDNTGLPSIDDLVAAHQGNSAYTVPPVDPNAPATPGTLDYIVGLARRGLASFGNNLQAGSAAEVGSMPGQPPPTPESLSVPTQAQANTELFGRPNVVAPNAPARYLGGAAEAVTSNPILSMIPGGVVSTVGGSVGSQAGADLFPNSRIAPVIGGLVGGSIPSLTGTAARLALGTPSQAAGEALNLGKQYGVNIPATSVPGSSPVVNGGNALLAKVPFSGAGSPPKAALDQWHQALNTEVGAPPTTTITPMGLAKASDQNMAIINHAESKPLDGFNLAVQGQVPTEVASAKTYGEAFDKLDALAKSDPTQAARYQQMKADLQTSLSGETNPAGNPIGQSYADAVDKQAKLKVVQSLNPNGQIDPNKFTAAVNGAGDDGMGSLRDLSIIGSYLKGTPQTTTSKWTQYLAGAGELAALGGSVASHFGYGEVPLAVGQAAVALGAGGRVAAKTLAGPRVSNILASKALGQSVVGNPLQGMAIGGATALGAQPNNPGFKATLSNLYSDPATQNIMLAALSNAYSDPTSKANPADNSDTGIEHQPPNQDALTRDVISNQRRLSGARGAGLKERRT